VTREHLEEKIAEAIVRALGFSNGDFGFGLSRTAAIKRELVRLRAKVERVRDDYAKAAAAHRKVHPARAALDERDADAARGLLSELEPIGRDLGGPGEHLDDLTVDIVAVFDHATLFHPKHVVTKIAPGIFDAAHDRYPDLVPENTREGPLGRWRRASRRILAEPSFIAPAWPVRSKVEAHLFHRRINLFAGDDRFHLDLFEQHRRRPSRP
jgi:hypothetical protein